MGALEEGPDIGEIPVDGVPAFVRPGMEPFDPISVSRLTRRMVCEGDARKYTRFYCAGVYGGISTGYTVGCNLRCVFCWVGLSRDFPHRYGKLYSAEEAASELVRNARKKGFKRMRISGGEPTLCRDHLLRVLELTEGSGMGFILETNGVILGADESYVEELERFSHFHLRLSLKAGDSGGWEKRTGATAESFDLPYRAISLLLRHHVSFHVAAMTDPGLMPEGEREELFDRLNEAGYRDRVEEEACDPYKLSVFRLKESGYSI